MKTIVVAGLLSAMLSIFSGLLLIPILRKIKAGQTVLHFVEEHKNKNGTPTMGGLFFITSAVIIFFLFGGGEGRMAIVAVSIGLSFMLVGFIDDFIKIRFHRNEGLKAYQKIIFQSAIAVIAGIFAYKNGITVFHIPFSLKTVDIKIYTIPIVAIIFIAITNSVNLTDGLDGLAGNVSLVYLLSMTALVIVQATCFKRLYLRVEEYYRLNLLSVCLVGALCGFLVFNSSKARIFMGDTGSLSLGGFIGAISIFTSNSFFIPVIGIMFVLSSISVIVQVTHYKRTKKRVFLMSPLHHHFQMKGYSETQISYCYSLVTAVFGIVSVLFYL